MSDLVEAVYQFEKPRALVRAYIADYRGRRYVHIREFVEPRDQPGAALIATKAGICVEVSDLDELEACVAALRKALEPPTCVSGTHSDARARPKEEADLGKRHTRLLLEATTGPLPARPAIARRRR